MSKVRFETQISKTRAAPFEELAKDLGLSRSELVRKALEVYFEIQKQTKLGNKIAYLSKDGKQKGTLTTPETNFLEWTQTQSEVIKVSEAAIDAFLQKTPPNEALKELMKDQSVEN